MKNKKNQKERLEELIPDEKKRKEVLDRLYKGEPILGEGGIFTDMLQAFVNAALEGEMDNHLKNNKGSKTGNRRNGYNNKEIRSTAGPLSVKTPREYKFLHIAMINKNTVFCSSLENGILFHPKSFLSISNSLSVAPLAL